MQEEMIQREPAGEEGSERGTIFLGPEQIQEK